MEHRISFTPLAVTPSAPARPIAPRTKMLLDAPILPTLLRLSAPNVLNLLAIVGMVTFDAIFVGRLGPDALAGMSLVFPWVMFMQHAAASEMGGGVASDRFTSSMDSGWRSTLLRRAWGVCWLQLQRTEYGLRSAHAVVCWRCFGSTQGQSATLWRSPLASLYTVDSPLACFSAY